MADLDPALEEGQDNPERPEWLPENFDSPEAFAASYKEAQRKITELANEKRGLEESVNTLSQQFSEFTAQQNQPDPSLVEQQLLEAYETNPIALMAEIARSTYEQQSKQAQQQPGVKPEDFASYVANQTLTARYEDFSELAPKIREVIESNPLYHNDAIWVNPDLATQAMDNAYQTVKAQDILSGNSIAEQAAADTRAMKLAAQTAAGASGRTPAVPDDVAEWQRIKDAGQKQYWQ